MNIIWVSPFGSDTTGDGSEQSPYLTIEKAITVSVPEDQIRLKDGTYTPVDSLVFSGSGSLVADNPWEVTIQPAAVSSTSAVISIANADRFTVRGIIIKQATNPTGNFVGIAADTVAYFVCESCSVEDFTENAANVCGISANDCGGVIKDCSVDNFYNAGANLYGISAKELEIIDCTIGTLTGTTVVGIDTFGSIVWPSLNAATGAACINYITVDVTFDKDMLPDFELTNPANYTITNSFVITVMSVSILSTTQVRLITTGLPSTESCTVYVSSDMRDTGGHPVDPLHNFAVFMTVDRPDVVSATAINYNTIRIVFGHNMSDLDGNLTDEHNYVFSGLVPVTASSVAIVNLTTVDVTTSAFPSSVAYTVTVSNAKDTLGNAIDPYRDTRPFTSAYLPRVSDADAVDYNTVTVDFDMAMMNDAALNEPTNYVFVIGVITFTATGVTVMSPTQVSLDVAEFASLENYTVIVSNVINTVGSPLDINHNNYAFMSVKRPWVASASSPGGFTVIVTFDSDMQNNPALILATNYVISGTSTPAVASVVRDSATQVTCTLLTDMDPSSPYIVTVSNVEDTLGNIIDPLNNSAVFVSSAGVLAHYKLDLDVLDSSGHGYHGTLEKVLPLWNEENKTGVKPGIRVYSSLAYDSARNVTVLFGGYISAPQQDTWEYDGTTWVGKTPVSGNPPARYYAMMCFDSVRNETVLFGGSSSATTSYNDTWVWNGATWTQKFPSHSPTNTTGQGRRAAGMTFDTNRGKVVLFGGVNCAVTPTTYQDTWEWDGTDWTQITPAGGIKPSARSYFGMVYDSSRQRCLVFGGRAGSGVNNNECWEWDGTTWVNRTPAGFKPNAIMYHGMAYDSLRNLSIVHQGYTTGYLNDTWEWNGGTQVWTQRFPVSKAVTIYGIHSMVYDVLNQNVLFYGGEKVDGSGKIDQTWLYGNYGPGKLNRGLYFDGQDTVGASYAIGAYQGVKLPAGFASLTSVSVAFWVKPHKELEPNKSQSLVTYHQWNSGTLSYNPVKWYSVIGTDKHVRFAARFSGGSAGYDMGDLLTNDSWSHLAMTARNGVLKCYFNGAYVGSATTSGNLVDVSGTANFYPTIGCAYWNSVNNRGEIFDGVIDDVRIYDRELSATEITNLFNSYPP